MTPVCWREAGTREDGKEGVDGESVTGQGNGFQAKLQPGPGQPRTFSQWPTWLTQLTWLAGVSPFVTLEMSSTPKRLHRGKSQGFTGTCGLPASPQALGNWPGCQPL